MYNKYKNKTYTQGIQNEVSDTENESKIIITNNNDKNSSDAEQDKCLKTTFTKVLVKLIPLFYHHQIFHDKHNFLLDNLYLLL